MDFSSRLLLFLEIVEMGTFTKVSEYRNVDRSVISKQISRLEDELGVRVFNRTTRSISLTAAGLEMVKQALQIRDILQDTQRIAQNYHSDPQGILRITCPSYLGRYYVNKAALAFQKDYPNVRLELRLEDKIIDIVAEGYDIGIRSGRPKDSSLIIKKLAPNKTMLVAAPSLLERYGHPENVEDVEALPAAIYATTGLVGDRVRYFDGKVDGIIKLDPVYRTNEDELYLKAAVEGVGIAYILAYMVQDEIRDGKLVPILPKLTLADFGDLYAVYPHKEAPKKTKLFIEYLQKEMSGLAEK